MRMIDRERSLTMGRETVFSGIDRLHWIILAIIVGVGIALRLHTLSRPILLDEAFTFLEYGLSSIPRALSNYSANNNHLLHTLFMQLSTRVFGDDVWAIRLPAFAFGVGLIPLTYAVGRLLYNRSAGLIAAALVAVSVGMIDYSANARGYSMLTCFAIVQLGLGVLILRRPRAWMWAGFGVCCALGFYTIPIYLFPCGGLCLWLLVSLIVEKRGDERRASVRNFVITLIAAAALTIVLYLPVLLRRDGLNRLLNNDSMQMFSLETQGISSPFVLNIEYVITFITQGLWLPVIVVVAIGVLVGVIVHRRISTTRIPPLLPMIAWLLPFMLLLPFVPPMRTWIFLIPILAITSGAGLVYLIERVLTPNENHNAYRMAFYAAGAGVIALLVATTFTSSAYAALWLDSSPQAEAIADLLAPDIEQLAMVMLPFPHDSPVRYYLYKREIGYEAIRGEFNAPPDLLDEVPPDGRIYAFLDTGRTLQAFIALYGLDVSADALTFTPLNTIPAGTLGELTR